MEEFRSLWRNNLSCRISHLPVTLQVTSLLLSMYHHNFSQAKITLAKWFSSTQKQGAWKSRYHIYYKTRCTMRCWFLPPVYINDLVTARTSRHWRDTTIAVFINSFKPFGKTHGLARLTISHGGPGYTQSIPLNRLCCQMLDTRFPK